MRWAAGELTYTRGLAPHNRRWAVIAKGIHNFPSRGWAAAHNRGWPPAAQLWVAAGLPESGFARRSGEWSKLGFQGQDPTTDLRGGGARALPSGRTKNHPCRKSPWQKY